MVVLPARTLTPEVKQRLYRLGALYSLYRAGTSVQGSMIEEAGRNKAIQSLE